MKKKLSYRDKLLELANIYDVKEIKDYEKRRKSLTSGQLELILKKNKIIIPKDFKSNFLRRPKLRMVRTSLVSMKLGLAADRFAPPTTQHIAPTRRFPARLSLL